MLNGQACAAPREVSVKRASVLGDGITSHMPHLMVPVGFKIVITLFKEE